MNRLTRQVVIMAAAAYCGISLPIGTQTKISAATPKTTASNLVLWRIGNNDDANSEFTGAAMPTDYTVTPNWAAQKQWPEWPATVNVKTPSVTTINYRLSKVPVNGALFTFKATDSCALLPELAVYSNYNPCGIIQLAGNGSPGWGPPAQYIRRFTREYQIYIPAEFLVAGQNKLQISRLGHPYKRSSTLFLHFGIDYMQLDALASPATEPIHGKVSYLGISDGQFDVNPSTIAKAQAEAEWLGIAYSQNPERVGYFQDLAHMEADPDKLAYLKKLKELNMTLIMNGWNCGHTKDSMIVDGQLPAAAQAYTRDTFSRYGAYARFYEICNEPSMHITQASQQYCLAMAKFVNSIKPASMILAAPGYAFGGNTGDPVNWDDGKHDANRTELDALCGAYNGHSWAGTYWIDNGSLAENIDAHGTFVNGNPQVTNGFDKPFITTECGSATVHKDFSQAASLEHLYSSALDRNLRANMAFGDYICAADVWNNGVMYDYLSGTPTDPTTWVAAPANAGDGDVDTRVKTLRRLALAYATHGTPLHYTWTNIGTDLTLAYFRAVDTSTLAPIPGSGATSNKILLSFVNFDLLNPSTISVRVTMPASGTYSGVCYNSANTYTAARSMVTGLVAKPTHDFAITLGPGESTEYILDKL